MVPDDFQIPTFFRGKHLQEPPLEEPHDQLSVKLWRVNLIGWNTKELQH
jgi:hypothetical protein